MEENQGRIFAGASAVILAAGIVVAYQNGKIASIELFQARAIELLMASASIGSGLILLLLMVSQSYSWWGKAQGSLVAIFIGSIASIIFGIALWTSAAI